MIIRVMVNTVEDDYEFQRMHDGLWHYRFKKRTNVQFSRWSQPFSSELQARNAAGVEAS